MKFFVVVKINVVFVSRRFQLVALTNSISYPKLKALKKSKIGVVHSFLFNVIIGR